MSDFFYPIGNDNITVAELSSRRAALFVAMTHAAAAIHSISQPVIERIDDSYKIHPEKFCDLVEKIFEFPIDILSVWALYAAAFYEVLKGEECLWYWSGGSYEKFNAAQVKEIVPYRDAHSPRLPLSDKKIGPARLIKLHNL